MTDEKHELVTVEEDRPQRVVTPLDLPTEAFASALDRRGENRTKLVEWVKSKLTDGVDYGRIKIGGRMSKPSLYKPGAEKICGMLGVTVTFPSLNEYEKAAYSGVDITHVVLRCDLLDGNGNVIATGAGARSLAQDRNDLNKCIKMAEKSGHIDATLRLAGLSEVFTQDIEDMKREDIESKDPLEYAPPPPKKESKRDRMKKKIETLEGEAFDIGMLKLGQVEDKRAAIMAAADLDSVSEADIVSYGKILKTEIEKYKKENA